MLSKRFLFLSLSTNCRRQCELVLQNKDFTERQPLNRLYLRLNAS